ncbi:hypothetical protein O9992_27120 [Vibrio lentus]|nr:hypothetical protein [Vibrio lentus]
MFGPPVIKHLVGKELSLENVCTANHDDERQHGANVVSTWCGWSYGLTEFLRLAGDSNTRLDHMEPELNHSRPGDARDTTTPNSDGGYVKMSWYTEIRCHKTC